MDVGEDDVVNGGFVQPDFFERGEGIGYGVVAAAIDERGASVFHHQVYRGQFGANVA